MEKGKVIVTGATGSIGVNVVRRLLAKGIPVIMACRNMKKAYKIKDSINEEIQSDVEVVNLDLTSFKSILKFIEVIANQYDKPVGLLNNAGIMCRNFSKTEDGFETTIEVNYIGTFLLTRLIIPLMSENFSIVNTVSLTCKVSEVNENFFDVNEETFKQLGTYGNSKLALLLFSLSLSEKISNGNHINMTDPGVVNSNMISMKRWFDPLANLIFRPFCKSPVKGAIPAINALMSDKNGILFSGNGHKVLKDKYRFHKYKDWLWNKTEELIYNKGIDLDKL